MKRPGFFNGTPPPKPEQKTPFIDKLKNLKEVAPGLMPRSKVDILKMYMDEALKDGEITQEQHTEPTTYWNKNTLQSYRTFTGPTPLTVSFGS